MNIIDSSAKLFNAFNTYSFKNNKFVLNIKNLKITCFIDDVYYSYFCYTNDVLNDTQIKLLCDNGLIYKMNIHYSNDNFKNVILNSLIDKNYKYIIYCAESLNNNFVINDNRRILGKFFKFELNKKENIDIIQEMKTHINTYNAAKTHISKYFNFFDFYQLNLSFLMYTAFKSTHKELDINNFNDFISAMINYIPIYKNINAVAPMNRYITPYINNKFTRINIANHIIIEAYFRFYPNQLNNFYSNSFNFGETFKVNYINEQDGRLKDAILSYDQTTDTIMFFMLKVTDMILVTVMTNNYGHDLSDYEIRFTERCIKIRYDKREDINKQFNIYYKIKTNLEYFNFIKKLMTS